MIKKNRELAFQKLHRTEWQGFLWNRFLEKSPKAADSLFSKYEKGVVAKRLAALALIRNGLGSREIGRVLWMSQATISALRKNFFGDTKEYKSQRSFKGSKRTHSIVKKRPNSWLDGLFKGVDILNLIKNPSRPASLGIMGKSGKLS